METTPAETPDESASKNYVFDLAFIDRFSPRIAAALIILAGLYVWSTFPAENNYRVGADEGAYYRMGKAIISEGFAGFHTICNNYLNTPSLQDYPNPIRIGTILSAALFLRFNDSYHALSFLSLTAYLVLLGATFMFIRRYWSGSLAVFTVLLMAVSPIEMAMARRALMDSLGFTTAALSFFAFFMVSENPSLRNKAAFIILTVFAILVKETASLLLLFYALALIFTSGKKRGVGSYIIDAATLLLPVAILTGLCYLLAYGWNNTVGIVHVIFGIVKGGNQYDQMFDRGPWYRYLLDFLMLSPFTLIAAIGFAGYFVLTREEKNPRTIWFLCFAAYLLFAYGFLAKNVRYVIICDLPLRFFAAYALLTLINSSAFFTLAKVLLLELLFVALDLVSFTSYFITNDIYDTVSFELLTAKKIIPAYNYSLPAEATITGGTGQSAIITRLKDIALKEPTATNYVNLSLQYYAEGLYLECILANEQALRFEPGNVSAYNNICAAYNTMKDWPDAIIAAKQALAIDSSFQLARNNLNWALSQQALEKK